MATADELESLAAWCERDEPSIDLRVAIGIALGWRKDFFIGGGTDYLMEDPHGRKMLAEEMPAWERSLDAAVTLVPEGWRMRNMDQGDSDLKYSPPSADAIPLNKNDEGWEAHGRRRPFAQAKTLALAICAAALKARAGLSKAEDASK